MSDVSLIFFEAFTRLTWRV